MTVAVDFSPRKVPTAKSVASATVEGGRGLWFSFVADATRIPPSPNRGLKPTATVILSLRDTGKG